MKAGELKTKAPSILAVGDVGTGKTGFWLTLGPAVEVLDLDGNIRSGLFCGDGWDEIRAQADVTDLEDDPTKPTAFEAARKRVQAIGQEIAKGDYTPKVIVVDSLSSLADAALARALKNSGSDPSDQPRMQDWGSMGRGVERLVIQLIALPVATVFIGHEKLEVVNQENRIKLGTKGQYLGDNLPRRFTDIWYFQSATRAGGKQSFEVHTRPKGAILARNSGGMESPFPQEKGAVWALQQLGWDVTGEGGGASGDGPGSE